MEIIEEEYTEEECLCKCKNKREGCCPCDCERCDPDWSPGIDTADEETTDEDSYDSDDSMDDVYEECGLTRDEKKILNDELNLLIEEAESAARYPQ